MIMKDFISLTAYWSTCQGLILCIHLLLKLINKFYYNKIDWVTCVTVIGEDVGYDVHYFVFQGGNRPIPQADLYSPIPKIVQFKNNKIH